MDRRRTVGCLACGSRKVPPSHSALQSEMFEKKPKKGVERPSDKDYTRPEDETARNAVFRLATHLATVEKKVDTLIEGLVEVKSFQPKLIEINEAMRGLSGDVDVVIDYMRNEYGLPIDPEAELNEYGDDDDGD